MSEDLQHAIRRAIDTERMDRALDAARLKMTFGKYADRDLGDIPITYLDQTISPMPDQWIIRQARLVVDQSMIMGGSGLTFYQRFFRWLEIQKQNPEPSESSKS